MFTTVLPLRALGKRLGENVSSLHIGMAVFQLEDLFVQAIVQIHDRNAMNPSYVAHRGETSREDDFERCLIVFPDT